MKESFLLYTKYAENIEMLTMEQRGILFTAIMNYAAEKDLPEMDGMVKMAFSFIRAQLDADTEKYNDVCRKRAEAGKMGGRPKKEEKDEKANGFSDDVKKANGFLEKQTKAKKPDNDNEYDNDNDNDNENDIKKTYTCAFESLWAAYPRKKEKAKAYKCYKARLADGFSEDELETAVKRYADECKINHTEEKYIKLGATFLGPNTPFTDYLGDWKPPAKEQKQPKKNQFNNFHQREYDFDDLERQLVGR